VKKSHKHAHKKSKKDHKKKAKKNNKKAQKHRKKAAIHTKKAQAAAKKGDKKTAAKETKKAQKHAKKAVKHTVVAKKEVKKVVAKPSVTAKAVIAAKPHASQRDIRIAKLSKKLDLAAFAKQLTAGYKKKKRVPHVVTAALADAIDDIGLLTEEDVAEAHKELQRIADKTGNITIQDVINVGEKLQRKDDIRSGNK